MITNIFLDIETVPADTFYQKEVADKVGPPASYTKKETIDQWWADKGEKAILDAVHATGLMPAYNRIVALSFAVDGEDPRTYTGDEYGLLGCFFDDLGYELGKRQLGKSMRAIGHNITGFDLPTIWHACIRNGLPYAFLPHPRKVKPWETEKVCDTLYQLAGTERKGMSLGNVCKLYGIEDAMPEIDGSMVWDLYRAGDIDKIAAYCENDVWMTRRLYSRIKDWT